MKRWLHTHRDGIALAICFACALVAAQLNDDRADARIQAAHSEPQHQGGQQ